jgi:hypothetical protein
MLTVTAATTTTLASVYHNSASPFAAGIGHYDQNHGQRQSQRLPHEPPAGAIPVVQPLHAEREGDPCIGKPDGEHNQTENPRWLDNLRAGINGRVAGERRGKSQDRSDKARSYSNSKTCQPPRLAVDAAFEAEEKLGSGSWDPSVHSLSSSLIEVLARVPLSTVFTITAQ